MSGVLYDIPDESRDYWGRYSVSEDTPVLWGDLWDPNWEDHVSDNWMEHFCLDWCGNCDCHMDEDDINRGGILCQFCEDEENGVEHQQLDNELSNCNIVKVINKKSKLI